MAYVVLARKWRPMVFEDVVGQAHVTRTLTNALKNQRIAHAYIFAGPRGVGKTTTARLLAKAVNCEKQPAVNPCNECSTCKSITAGNSMDVIEIDGASNRGIDEIRNLRENIRFAPASARYKIYIIDEVHMLTKEAFNALLKTLEEPPAHAIFIFATTEIHKVPLTILSRCQRFDFKRISVTRIREQLEKIVSSEKIEIDDDALLLISRKADGSMRDAESILDQMISFSDGKLTTEQVRQSLGLIDQEVYFDFTNILLERKNAEVLRYAENVTSTGHDVIDFLQGMQEHFRNLLIMASIGDANLLDVSDFYREKYQEFSKKFKELDLIHYIQIISDSIQDIKYSSFQQLSLEMLLLRLSHKPAAVEMEEVLAFIEKLKKHPETVNSISTSTQSAPEKKPSVTPAEKTEYPETRDKVKNPTFDFIKDKSAVGIKSSGSDFKKLENKLLNLDKLKSSDTKKETGEKKNEKIDLDLIKENWEKVIEKVRTEKVALASFLEEGTPYEIQNGRLVIVYDLSATFHCDLVKTNKKFIENIFRKDFDLPVNIESKTVDFKALGIEKQPRTPEEILEDIKNKEPMIQKIIEVFDLDETNKIDVH
jgi:DNA polymerase-3 subunit gamma/tau